MVPGMDVSNIHTITSWSGSVLKWPDHKITTRIVQYFYLQYIVNHKALYVQDAHWGVLLQGYAIAEKRWKKTAWSSITFVNSQHLITRPPSVSVQRSGHFYEVVIFFKVKEWSYKELVGDTFKSSRTDISPRCDN